MGQSDVGPPWLRPMKPKDGSLKKLYPLLPSRVDYSLAPYENNNSLGGVVHVPNKQSFGVPVIIAESQTSPLEFLIRIPGVRCS